MIRVHILQKHSFSFCFEKWAQAILSTRILLCWMFNLFCPFWKASLSRILPSLNGVMPQQRAVRFAHGSRRHRRTQRIPGSRVVRTPCLQFSISCHPSSSSALRYPLLHQLGAAAGKERLARNITESISGNEVFFETALPNPLDLGQYPVRVSIIVPVASAGRASDRFCSLFRNCCWLAYKPGLSNRLFSLTGFIIFWFFHWFPLLFSLMLRVLPKRSHGQTLAEVGGSVLAQSHRVNLLWEAATYDYHPLP